MPFWRAAALMRVNPPPEPFTISSSVATAATEPVQFTFYDLPLPAGYLSGPTNVLTVQVFNAGLASSDLGFDASLVASLDDVPPVVTSQAPFAGATVLAVSQSDNGAAVPFTRNYLARFNADGSLDGSFDANPNGFVLSLAVHVDNKVVVGGAFTSLSSRGGTARARISVVNATTSLAFRRRGRG